MNAIITYRIDDKSGGVILERSICLDDGTWVSTITVAEFISTSAGLAFRSHYLSLLSSQKSWWEKIKSWLGPAKDYYS